MATNFGPPTTTWHDTNTSSTYKPWTTTSTTIDNSYYYQSAYDTYTIPPNTYDQMKIEFDVAIGVPEMVTRECPSCEEELTDEEWNNKDDYICHGCRYGVE